MTYIHPADVISPKTRWHLFDVILDRGEGECAYALGTWDGDRRIGFRWNGNTVDGPLGNPQSRGLPTWTILDPALHDAVLALLAPEKQILTKRFLGLRDPAIWRSVLADIRLFHSARLHKIVAGEAPLRLAHSDILLLHVIPLSAFEAVKPNSYQDLFRNPERFAPMGRNYPCPYKITESGLFLISNSDGFEKEQRAYTHVSRLGVVEAVDSGFVRSDDCLELPKPQLDLVRYAQMYSSGLSKAGMTSPFVIVASLSGVEGVTLLGDYINTMLPICDMHGVKLKENCYTFSESLFETVPMSANESAHFLLSTLDHMTNLAGLPSTPGFDEDGNYFWK
jgi:hypothetical protein